MKCFKCKCDLSNDSRFCTSCGTDLFNYSVRENFIVCPLCAGETPIGSKFCTNCRAKLVAPTELEIKEEKEITAQQIQISMQAAQLRTQRQQLDLQMQQTKMQAAQMQSMSKCPRCGSTSLSGQKKGYGIGKGVFGLAISAAVGLGPIGLIAGNMGAKKVRVTCINCGKKFWAGRR